MSHLNTHIIFISKSSTGNPLNSSSSDKANIFEKGNEVKLCGKSN